MRKKALRVIADFVAEKLHECPIRRQIEVYEALSSVMPTSGERKKAEEIAVTLSEVAKLQLDFNRQLFRELQWPGHQHNGEKNP